MSLEMIANPEIPLLREHEVKIVEESLHILGRCGMIDASRCLFHAGKILPELREELLTAAQGELRAVRRQLTFWRILWATLRHRDERAVWKPYWGLRERQGFHDGALVAWLLATVRLRLSKKEYTLTRKDWRAAKKALRITAAITGDKAAIKALLARKPWESLWPPEPPVEKTGKTRWLPWQRRTRSWQAAYNTACLYAAMAQSCKGGTADHAEMARRAVVSLRRVIYDRDCQMERPWDWISHDPDFFCLQKRSLRFKEFLCAQEHKDYPMLDTHPTVSRHQLELLLVLQPGRMAALPDGGLRQAARLITRG